MLWTYGPMLGLTAAVTVVMQLSFFFVAYTFQFDKVTDFAGSMNFVLLAWLTYGLGDTFHVRQTVNTILITAWGVRLGLYLLARVLKRGHDARFDEMRSRFFAFLGFWIFQILWVWLVSLPIIFLNAAPKDVSLGPRDYAGWALWGIGFIFEVAADQSKDAFMANPANKGKIIMSGVWSLTRHPNYFGEIILWLGMFVTCSSVFEANNVPGGYVSVLSPAFTFAILMFGSGITLAEERYNKRHGTDGWYLEYRKQTSPLWPVPPIIYRNLPDVVKLVFFFELPLYAKGLPGPDGPDSSTALQQA